MSITDVNAKYQTYYRPQDTTKTGKPTSKFLLRSAGKSVIVMPANFVIGKILQAYVL